MFAFEPLSPITEWGAKSYDAQWSLWFSREFSLNFYLYWLLLAFLFYVVGKLRFNLRLASRKIMMIRRILVLFPALFCWYGIEFQTLGFGHYEDEISYIYQARLLANGKPEGLLIPKEIVNSYSVPNIWVNQEGRLVGSYAIGYPMLLAPFEWLGWRAFFPVLLCFLSTLIIFRILGLCFSSRRIIPYLLVGFNPWFASFSVYFFSQSAMLLVCSFILLRRLKQLSFTLDWILIAVAILIRPPDALILATTLGSWQLITYYRNEQKISRAQWFSPLFMLGAFPLHFLNQKWITGSYFEPTYSVFSSLHKLGFAADVGILQPWGYNLAQAFKNLSLVLLSLNDSLFGWPALSLLPILLAGWFSKVRKPSPIHRRMLLFASLVLVFWFGFYFLYFYPGICFGPRFHFPLFPFFIVLSAYGILCLAKMRLVFGLLTLLSLWNCFQWQERLKDSGGVLSDPIQLIEARHRMILDESRIYLIKDEDNPGADVTQRSLFSQFHHLNDPFDLDNPRFLRFSDYQGNPAWFNSRYAKGFQILNFKAQVDD